jgi:hypothetical protein
MLTYVRGRGYFFFRCKLGGAYIHGRIFFFLFNLRLVLFFFVYRLPQESFDVAAVRGRDAHRQPGYFATNTVFCNVICIKSNDDSHDTRGRFFFFLFS